MEKGLRPRGNVVAWAHRGSPMTVPVKILSALFGLSLAGGVHARIWTNDRGATVVATLVAVRDAEVDLRLQDGRVVAVSKNIFSGADQAYIQEWVQSGGTLADTDADAVNTAQSEGGGTRYVRLEPNWEAPWPARAGAAGFLLVKPVQETDELSVYETDHFVIESPGKLTETERQALARRFEAILAVLSAVPMNLTVARKPSRKYLVRVCFLEEEFNRVPGLLNGRLKFSPTSFTALLLRDRKGNPQKLDAVDPRFAVTHWVMQSMDMEHWLVDGFSGYMAFLPMEKGEASFQKIPARLAGRLPRSVRTGREALPALEDMFARDSSHSSAVHDRPLKGNGAGYWGDMLWTVYWCHLEGDGKAGRLRHYLKAWDAEERERAHALLLDGKSPGEVQQDMAAAWRKLGVKLKFAPPSSPAEEEKKTGVK